MVIELDYRQVERAKMAGFATIYGDASQPTVLEAAKVQQACLVLVTTPAITVTQAIIDQIRGLNQTVHIVARAEGIAQMRALHARGIYEVIQPEFEASLEITRQALLHLNIPPANIQNFTDTMRQELSYHHEGIQSDTTESVPLWTPQP